MARQERSTAAFSSVERNYWEYYRELEDDFLSTRKYASFSKANCGTYSMEFLKLFQAVCSEIDVVGKAMAAACNPRFNPTDQQNNIKKWWYEIQREYRCYENAADAVAGSGGIRIADCARSLLARIEIAPWRGFETEWRTTKDGRNVCELSVGASTPTWWSAYNSVKHSRFASFSVAEEEVSYSKANLGNLASAFAALHILETAFLGSVGTLSDLQAFANRSVLFDKAEHATAADIVSLF